MTPSKSGQLRGALGGGAAGEAREAGGRRIAGTIGIVLVGRVVGIAISLVTLPLITRTLGTSGFGVWSAGLAYVGLFTAITEFGLTNAATLRMSADHEREAEWLGALGSLRTVFGGVLGLLCVAGIPLVLSDQGDLRLVALILVVSIVPGGAGSLMAVFQSRLRPGLPVLFNLLQSLLWLAVVVTLAATDGDAVFLAVGYVVASFVIAAVQITASRRIARVVWRGARERWLDLLRVAVPIGLGGIFVTIYYKLDAILLYQIAGAREAGIYGAAYRFLDPIVFIPGAIMAAFLPVMSAARGHDDARVRHLVQTCGTYMAVVSLPALAVTLVLSGAIVHLILGDEYARSATVLPILMGAFTAICFGNLAGYLAPVLGLQWRITLFAAVGALANVGLNLLLIPDYGAEGSAWATVVTESLTMALLLTTCLRRLGMRLQVGRMIRAAAAAAVMGAAMLAVRPLGLLPALVAGGVVYTAALLLLRAVRLDELRSLRAARAA